MPYHARHTHTAGKEAPSYRSCDEEYRTRFRLETTSCSEDSSRCHHSITSSQDAPREIVMSSGSHDGDLLETKEMLQLQLRAEYRLRCPL
jgi:hypothetical protein